jgi:hypothetical protein
MYVYIDIYIYIAKTTYAGIESKYIRSQKQLSADVLLMPAVKNPTSVFAPTSVSYRGSPGIEQYWDMDLWVEAWYH